MTNFITDYQDQIKARIKDLLEIQDAYVGITSLLSDNDGECEPEYELSDRQKSSLLSALSRLADNMGSAVEQIDALTDDLPPQCHDGDRLTGGTELQH
ncbi:MAG: hypothetical protein KZQ73_00805 [Candidatus Thiodiazotropha sp. (ex Semelilucina semeliformis)]|nr:hypothetical protein [Candidatus Thiodiazotropha sp. (ex Semelilucina semeliformis)]